MIDLSPLARRLAGTPLAEWANTLQAQLDKKMEKGHGDLERWQSALDALPKIQPSEVDLLNGLKLDTDCDDDTRAQMRTALMGLSPISPASPSGRASAAPAATLGVRLPCR